MEFVFLAGIAALRNGDGRSAVVVTPGARPATALGEMLGQESVLVVEQVAFRSDNAGLFTAHGDGTVRLIHCEVCGPIDDVRTMADSRVTRSLTTEERGTYLGEPS